MSDAQAIAQERLAKAREKRRKPKAAPQSPQIVLPSPKAPIACV